MRLLAIALLLLPVAVAAQSAAKIPRLCVLAFDPELQVPIRFQPFFHGLRDLGYVDGKNITIDIRAANGVAEQFPALAAQCVASRADVIVVTTTPAAQAAKQATSTIPIVMHPLGDPVGTGLVKSLARPGGNVTGLTFMAPDIAAKRLGLLKEAIPRLSRVLVLSYLVDPIAPPQVAEMRKAAATLGIKLQVHEVRTVEDIAAGYEAGVREKAEAVMVTSESIFAVNRAQLLDLAAKYRLPSMFPALFFVENGALMSYAHDAATFNPRTAIYVDRILKGAKPADLPVEQPTTFVLAVNLKTAKALGLTIPPTVLLRANRTIE